jgi:hypothetical protein
LLKRQSTNLRSPVNYPLILTGEWKNKMTEEGHETGQFDKRDRKELEIFNRDKVTGGRVWKTPGLGIKSCLVMSEMVFGEDAFDGV